MINFVTSSPQQILQLCRIK